MEKNTARQFLLCLLSFLAIVSCDANKRDVKDTMPTAKNDVSIWPTLDIEVKQDPAIEQRIKAILAEMTLPQKIAQMIQPEIRDISVEDMRKYGFGSYLNGGGAFPNNDKHATPQDWIKLAEDMYQASIDDSLDGATIPTMWGTDAVHGHNNVIGATLFPHNIGLGAANNPALIEKIANITATEVMVTGIDWVFAPTVATVRDDRWGRTYEGYSEDPEIVKAYSKAIVKGLQGHANKDFLSDNRVISTIKHFIGDGGTVGGDDQGNNVDTEQVLFDIHAQGYVGGLEAGAQSVMASFNSWHGKKMHGNKYLLTDVLKDKMGFDGFIVGDWNGHGQIAGCDNENCAQAINAGLDIFMVPSDWKALYENTLTQAKDGTIPMSRIDDAVSRILRVKLRAGMFEKPSPAKRKFSGRTELIGAKSHREVAAQAVRESLVLLKNKNGLLPLNPKSTVLVAGDGADNIGNQSGGWSITWQGTNNTNADFPGAQSIYAGIRDQVEAAGGEAVLSVDGSFEQKPDVAIVVFGEEPYAEGSGDTATLEYQAEDKRDLALLQKLKQQGIPVVAVFITGRPLWVNAEINASDAFVVAWLPGTEGQGVAEVIFANADGSVQNDFTGKLSFSWPQHPTQVVNRFDQVYEPLLPYGFGLRYGDENLLADNLLEVSDTAGVVTTSWSIYQRSTQKPWALNLVSEAASELVTANTASLGAVSYRTVDRFVQEDAFQLSFSGNALAGIAFKANDGSTKDISHKMSDEGVLQLSVNVLQKPTAPVAVIMRCNRQDSDTACTASVDITEQLNAFDANKWSSLSIELTCFSQQGVQFDNLLTVFELTTAGSLELAIDRIAVDTNSLNNAQISCK